MDKLSFAEKMATQPLAEDATMDDQGIAAQYALAEEAYPEPVPSTHGTAAPQ